MYKKIHPRTRIGSMGTIGPTWKRPIVVEMFGIWFKGAHYHIKLHLLPSHLLCFSSPSLSLLLIKKITPPPPPNPPQQKAYLAAGRRKLNPNPTRVLCIRFSPSIKPAAVLAFKPYICSGGEILFVCSHFEPVSTHPSPTGL